MPPLVPNGTSGAGTGKVAAALAAWRPGAVRDAILLRAAVLLAVALGEAVTVGLPTSHAVSAVPLPASMIRHNATPVARRADAPVMPSRYRP